MRILMQPEDRRKIYGRTYTPRDEALKNLTYGVKVFAAGLAVAFGITSYHATKDANMFLDMLKGDFEAASTINNPKALETILKERDHVLKMFGCIPPHAVWTKNYDGTFYYSDAVCFNIPK